MTTPQSPDPFAGLAAAAPALPPLPALLLQLLLALALALPVAFVYARTHQGTSYSRTFVQSLVLLPLVVTIVMLAIGDSMARAFGLFGALALIRFRTPIKDSRDTIFLFLAVAVGITVGVANTLLAVAGTAFVLVVAIALAQTGFGRRIGHDGVLQFTVAAPTSDQEERVRAVLAQHCRRFDLVSLRDARQGGAMDYAYQLRLRAPRGHEALVNALRAVPGAQDVSLLVDDGRAES
jgi:hypothetical protein